MNRFSIFWFVLLTSFNIGRCGARDLNVNSKKFRQLYQKKLTSNGEKESQLHEAMGTVPSVKEYLEQRRQVLQDETDMLLGGNLLLTHPNEVKVNKILMELKNREFNEGVNSNGKHFAAAEHFFQSRERIEASNVFKIIKILPKGCAFHVHMVAASQVEFVSHNLTYMDHLYICQHDLDKLTFHFYEGQPEVECAPGRNWTLVSELRKTSSSEEFLNKLFFNSMSLWSPEPEVEYPDTNKVWETFNRKLKVMSGITSFAPAHRQYFYRGMEEFYEDNVMCIESRGGLSRVYNLNQSKLTRSQILEMYDGVTKQFTKKHPDFWGLKFILTTNRFQTPKTISKRISEAIALKSKFPDLVVGFDLVGQEDVGSPLMDYLPELLEARKKNLKLFFHAGETAWHGTKIDENLVDAILLNATRLGHAYALTSHPLLVDLVKTKGIAVECCPISNQVLNLVHDLRNHPAIGLMTKDFPLVIASDDPGIWGARGLSHDWYMAFMAMAGTHADLRFLKRLALNSIEYSSMGLEEKTVAYSKWNVSWQQFLTKVISIYSNDRVQ